MLEAQPAKLDADEVAPGLWVGRTPPNGVKLPGIDVVVLAAVEKQTRYFPGSKIIQCPLDDAVPSTADVERAIRCAEAVSRHRARGKTVLVACDMGINRSAWIAAMSLVLDGMDAEEAIAQVRRRRRLVVGHALSNQDFVRVVRMLGATS